MSRGPGAQRRRQRRRVVHQAASLVPVLPRRRRCVERVPLLRAALAEQRRRPAARRVPRPRSSGRRCGELQRRLRRRLRPLAAGTRCTCPTGPTATPAAAARCWPRSSSATATAASSSTPHGELPDHLPMVLEFAAVADPDGGAALLQRVPGRASSCSGSRCRGRRRRTPAWSAAVCATLPGASPPDRAAVQAMAGPGRRREIGRARAVRPAAAAARRHGQERADGRRCCGASCPTWCSRRSCGGTIWRYRYDKFGWTTRSSQLYESRLLRIGSPLFHFGILVVVHRPRRRPADPGDLDRGGRHLRGHVPLQRAALRRRSPASARWPASCILIYPPAHDRPGLHGDHPQRQGHVRRAGRRDRRSGCGPRWSRSAPGHDAHNYRETVSPWFRSIFVLQPDVDAMAAAPMQFHVHVLVGMLLFTIWPFTRLVHAFTAPVHYLFRPYIVYRSRDARTPAPTGRPRAGLGPGRHPTDRDRSTTMTRRPAAAPSYLTSTGQTRNLALATLAFAISFWAWNMIGPLGVRYAEELGLSLGREVAARRDARAGRVARPDPRRRAHRPVRRPADVHGAAGRDGAVRAAGRLRRQPGLLRAAAALRVLPRHRRHDVRGRHPVRQRLVRAPPARLRHRRLRRRHGRHRAVGVLHPAVRRRGSATRRPT